MTIVCKTVYSSASFTIRALTPRFVVDETTIAAIHAALRAGETTCVEIVQAHLDRIAAYDRRGPALSALITVNPQALATARAQDASRAAGAPFLPLTGIPVIIKDNYDTCDLPTTGGSVALATSMPPDDAFVVRRLREAGAILLAKANLTELARGGTTVSRLGGQTRNPYDLTRTPGGSSGGTGAAIAASFGVVGTGSDTLQSTRSPASANGLVGLRPTRGLISRDGLIPYSATQDEAGPIARTVEDAARLLDAMVGYDPADPITERSRGKVPAAYAEALDASALRGARLGVLTDVFGREGIHEPVNRVMAQATAVMAAAGAHVSDVTIPGLTALTVDLALSDFEGDAFNRYLASLGPGAPVRHIREVIAIGVDPAIDADMRAADAGLDGRWKDEYARRLARRDDLRRAIASVMDEARLDALVYPHQRRLVARIGELQLERNGVLANGTGFPAVTVPGGFSEPTGTAPLGVPVGVEFLGREWAEPLLLRLAFAFEQATRHRRAPLSVPPLGGRGHQG